MWRIAVKSRATAICKNDDGVRNVLKEVRFYVNIYTL